MAVSGFSLFEVTIEKISPAQVFVTSPHISGWIPKVEIRNWVDGKVSPGTRVTLEIRNWFINYVQEQKEKDK